MQFHLETSIEINIDDSDAREKGYLLSGKILHVEFDESGFESRRTEMGRISAYRILGEADALFAWADNANQDLQFAVEWLCRQEGDLEEMALTSGCLYLNNVWVEPAWRGRGLALKAVAAFLELFARNGFVFLRPYPYEASEDPNERERQIEKLWLHWQQLGLNHYDPKENILWESEWYCPEPLLGTEAVL